MKDAAEPVDPTYAEPLDLFWFGVRLRRGAQRSCLVHRLVGPVAVAVSLELT
ncbi:hypothetical protein ABZ746_06700 [Streptomyces sp. NPDC020096]